MAEAASGDPGDVRAIMTAYAERTGLEPESSVKRRYLWTDAFAVCNFLSLHVSTADDALLELAVRLIDQVHRVLGRHRTDDSRSGWISGLSEQEGERRPTAAGLRIGKRLPERAAGQPPNEREEWDRDGQYFHYLTKWMHALERAAVATANLSYLRWALELAQAAHRAFVYRVADGSQRMYWKMSVDLSRPLVASMGHHDPLDALVTYTELEYCRVTGFADAQLPSLATEIADAAAMCAGRSWVTDDLLGIGGLLADISKLNQLQAHGSAIPASLLENLLSDAETGLATAASRYPFRAPAERRLAFRELGLAIGLRAVTGIEALTRFDFLDDAITSFWSNRANQSNSTWNDHVDINSVMLATSLLPKQFLLI